MKHGLVKVLFLALTVMISASLVYADHHEGAVKEDTMKEDTVQQTEPAQEVMAEEVPAFTIDRMVVCENVQNLEPEGTAEIFPIDTPKVFVFLEATDIADDTSVSFVWHYEENQAAKVDLTLKKGDRWRTYSSKNLAGLKGDWKVELQDSEGKVLKAIAFRVE